MTPQEYCQDKAAKSGSSFYYSFLFLPEHQRNAIIAVYAYCREVDDIVDTEMDPSIKQAKLNWWRSEIHNLYDDRPQHPITLALKPVLNNYNLPEEYFIEILDGMMMDLEVTRYASFSDLNLYCYRVASVVGLISAEIFGYQDRQTLKYAHDLGIAFQLTNIIRDVHDDFMRNRIYLPQDELARFHVNEADLRNPSPSPGFSQLMQFQIERAQGYYDKAFAQLPEADRYAQRAGIIMAAIYRKLLDKIAEDSSRILTERVSLTPVRKLWIAWRSRRQEQKRFQQSNKHGTRS